MMLLIKPGYKAQQLRRKVQTRQHDRAHAAFHIMNAERLRAEANQIEREMSAMQNDLSMPEGLKDAMQSRILDMRMRAIEEENGKCMEKHNA